MKAAILCVMGAAFAGWTPSCGASDVRGDEWVREQLARRPAVRAAELALEAERRGAQVLIQGSGEWSLSAGLAQRRQPEGGERTGEWEVSAQRPWRSAARQGASESMAQARLQSAQAARDLAWLTEARQLLERWSTWRRESLAVSLWDEQLAVLDRQRIASESRLRQGDIARVEALQVEASVGQAQAQRQLAEARARAALVALSAQFGSAPPVAAEAEAVAVAAPTDLATCEAGHPEVRAAEADLALANAQSQLDAADKSPEVSWGWRVSGVPRTGERVAGVMLSLPLPGRHRVMQSEASELRRRSVAASVEGRRQALRSELIRQSAEASELTGVWQRSDAAARRLDEVAKALERGWALGEGQLQDVLTARRLAIEQRLSAALTDLDVRAGQARLRLECGLAWQP